MQEPTELNNKPDTDLEQLKAELQMQKRLDILQLGVFFHGSAVKKGQQTPIDAAMQQAQLPLMKFGGVNTEAHYLSDPTRVTTELEELPFKERKKRWKMFEFNNPSASLVAVSPSIAEPISVATGFGMEIILARAMNGLIKLKAEGLLPSPLILGGYSRGAVEAIKLANAIYDKWGDEIKVHLLLDEPVPGPFRGANKDERTIPSNVETVTVFHALDERGGLLAPTAMSDVIIKSPATIVSAYGFHMFHAHQVIDANGQRDRLMQNEINQTMQSVCIQMVDVITKGYTNCRLDQAPCMVPPHEMQSTTARQRHDLYRLTPIANPEESPLKSLIDRQRKTFGYPGPEAVGQQLIDQLNTLKTQIQPSSNWFFSKQPADRIETLKLIDKLVPLLTGLGEEKSVGHLLTEKEVKAIHENQLLQPVIREWEKTGGHTLKDYLTCFNLVRELMPSSISNPQNP